MAYKIMKSFFRSIYFWISVLILIFFFTVTWYVNKQVEKETVQRVNDITEMVMIDNNIYVITNVFDLYRERLSYLSLTLEATNATTVPEKAIYNMYKMDESIDTIYMAPLGDLSRSRTEVWRETLTKDGRCFMKFSLPISSDHELILLVDLERFHQKLSKTKSFGNGYVTISRDHVYLYHPDESKIGIRMGDQDIADERRMIDQRLQQIGDINSDYLNIPVHRYYHTLEDYGEKWMLTFNVPNLGLKESIRKISNNFLIISLLAICSFSLVIGLGIFRWRREMIRRIETEQQNLILQLKNEQHKQTMVTAELERLKSGLNPHFLFNSLSSLRVLINKDSMIAKEFAITLSNLYRYMLKQESQHTVTLREELEFTEDYIRLQQIRFTNKIITDISLSKELKHHKVPPISLQLLVENCIKHTKISDSEPLHIRIFAEEDLLVVVNNYNPRESVTESTGLGIDNLIRRYSFLTQKECQFMVVENCYIAKIPLLFIS